MPTVRINQRQLVSLISIYIRSAYQNFSPLHRISFFEAGLPHTIEVEYERMIGTPTVYTNDYLFEEGETILLRENEICRALEPWLGKKFGEHWRVISIKQVLGKRAIAKLIPWEFPLLICAARGKSQVSWYIEPIGESNDAIVAYLDRTTGVHEAQFKFNGQLISAYYLPGFKAVSIMVANQDRFKFVFNVYRCGANGNYQRWDTAKLKRTLRLSKAVKGVQLTLKDIPTF